MGDKNPRATNWVTNIRKLNAGLTSFINIIFN